MRPGRTEQMLQYLNENPESDIARIIFTGLLHPCPADVADELRAAPADTAPMTAREGETMRTWIIFRHGCNAANQSMTPCLALGTTKALAEREAQELGLTLGTFYNNQHASARLYEECSEEEQREADEADSACWLERAYAMADMTLEEDMDGSDE